MASLLSLAEIARSRKQTSEPNVASAPLLATTGTANRCCRRRKRVWTPTFRHAVAAAGGLAERAGQGGAGPERRRGFQKGSGQQGANRCPLTTRQIKPRKEKQKREEELRKVTH